MTLDSREPLLRIAGEDFEPHLEPVEPGSSPSNLRSIRLKLSTSAVWPFASTFTLV
jgi:hypothetical protein